MKFESKLRQLNALKLRPSKNAQLSIMLVFATVTINKSLNEHLWQAIVTSI